MNATENVSDPHGYEPLPDNLLQSVLHSIGPEVLGSFSDEQLDSVENALRAEEVKQKHMLKVRGIIPLGFTRLYYLFLVGKDRRQKEMIIGKEHRDDGGFLAKLTFLATMALGSVAIMLVAVASVNNLVEQDLLEMFYIRDAMEYLGNLFGTSRPV